MSVAPDSVEYKDLFSPALKKATELMLDRGEGSYVFTTENTKYLDLVQGIAVNALGHCHPDLMNAAWDQIKRLGHASFNLASYPSVLSFARRLAQCTPGDLDMFFFTNSGAEAVEGALKLARYVTGKGSIIAFRGGFHGRTMGAASVTGSNAGFRRHYAPFLPQVYFAPYPYCYRCPFSKCVETCHLDCLNYLEQDFDYIIPSDDVGAVLIEPIQGEGGYVVPPEKYLTALRKLCSDKGILLIFDEIQTGMGRTGKLFACEHFGVVPDIMTLGKAIGGGYPMAVVASTRELMNRWEPGSHGTTFGGHPVPAASGLALLNILTGDGFLDQVAAKGVRFRTGLRELQKRFSCIGDIRGLGLMNAMELVRADGSPDAELTHRVIRYFHENKVLLLNCGVKGNVIRFIPALNIEEALLDDVLSLLEKALPAS